ncbi:MAG: ATP-dependent 6-phosphofructokinase [Sphaerochaetaceae bacterium]|nr:ATP-dependent 6-phosphofructokinase [Sphaerochaetaceae bacterium]
MSGKHDFSINKLGEAKILSPMIANMGRDSFSDFIEDEDRVVFNLETKVEDGRRVSVSEDTLEVAGARRKIYFNPAHVHAAIATCGGICPGLNNVIRSVVRCLWYSYGVHRISGIPYGYQGLLPESRYPIIELNPSLVDDIQEKGGTILGSARGGGDRTSEIVDTLEQLNINILFTVGGDGTLRGAYDIAQEVKKRGLKIAVVGIPKTIDNDLAFIQTSFGFDTAVSLAVPVIRGAHVEAKNAINGVGLVKVMGRGSGFIAAHASLAQSDVNFCLIPENPFDLDGPNGLLSHLKRRLEDRDHAVILVAEGAGQDIVPATGLKDASGNTRFTDIGVFLKEKIEEYFKKEGLEVNVKYIDPSYTIRSAPADSYDSIYCARLGANAVHAAMAGKTELLVSMINNCFIHMPIKEAVSRRNRINTESAFWRDVLENTRQPESMKN